MPVDWPSSKLASIDAGPMLSWETMIWLFDRGSERLRYEISRQDDGDGYLVVITMDDGRRRVEQVARPTELIEKSVNQMRRLRDSGWRIG